LGIAQKALAARTSRPTAPIAMPGSNRLAWGPRGCQLTTGGKVINFSRKH
jgi:hypothetical protein